MATSEAYRTSRLEVFRKKGVLKNFANFTEKHLCQSLGLELCQASPYNLLKKRPWYRRFSVKFAKFLRTPFFIEHLRWLLLGAVLKKCLKRDSDTGVFL